MGASSCSHEKHVGSRDSNIDELIFKIGEKTYQGMAVIKDVNTVLVRTPLKAGTVQVRAGSYAETFAADYPYTKIDLPDNSAEIIEIALASGSLGIIGTIYRADFNNLKYSLVFDVECGKKETVNSVAVCQLPVNSALKISVNVVGNGRAVVISSKCGYQQVQHGEGLKLFSVKGELCPIVIKRVDESGTQYGTILLRTATASYVPIEPPTYKAGDKAQKICAPKNINFMQSDKETYNPNKCRYDNSELFYLWDIQNGRALLWKR